MAKKLEERKKNLGGRPPKEIDENLVYELARTMLTNETIGHILDCCPDVLERRFSGALREGRADRKKSLIQSMWYNALEVKDVKMQIWLSKQHLGYKDVQPEEATQVHFNVHVNEVPR